MPPKPLHSINWDRFEAELTDSVNINHDLRTSSQIDTEIANLSSLIGRTLENNYSIINPTDCKTDAPGVKTALSNQTALVKDPLRTH